MTEPVLPFDGASIYRRLFLRDARTFHASAVHTDCTFKNRSAVLFAPRIMAPSRAASIGGVYGWMKLIYFPRRKWSLPKTRYVNCMRTQ